LDRMQEHRRDWLQHINRMGYSRLPRILKNNQQVEEQGRQLKRLLDAWDRNWSTSGPDGDDGDDDDDYDNISLHFALLHYVWFSFLFLHYSHKAKRNCFCGSCSVLLWHGTGTSIST
jgi:hypothetical protein